MSDERKRFEDWVKDGRWKATESMWAAWEARASLSEADQRDAAELSQMKRAQAGKRKRKGAKDGSTTTAVGPEGVGGEASPERDTPSMGEGES